MFGLISLAFGLWVWESVAPLKHLAQPRLQHIARNVFVFAIARGVFFLVSLLALERLSFYSLKPVLGSFFLIYVLVLSDLSVYWWHRMNHRVAFLWRFHQVHHLDRHLDFSSSLRFHFGEISLSYFYRSIVFLLFGFEVPEMLLYNIALTAGNLFIHSNINLGDRAQKLLGHVLVTPKFHRTHHSLYRTHTDSNYSSTWLGWDHLFGSHSGIHDTLEVGVPYQLQSSLKTDFLMPFEKMKPWPKSFKGMI